MFPRLFYTQNNDHRLFAYTLSKGTRSIGKTLLHHLTSQGKQVEEALMGYRFVGIPFIFTDLPTLPLINVFDKSLTM